MSQVNLITGYLKNVDEVIALAERESERFSRREPGQMYNFATQYGNSHMKSLFDFNMSLELKDAIFKTLPKEDRTSDSFVINRYDPGDYLQRHKDAQGGYWKFKLIFLRTDQPHFKWFDKDGNGFLVDEEPGALLDFPIHLEHEVTLIGQNERPKYSLVLTWGL